MLRTAKAGVQLLPAVARNPQILLRWLADARGAQVAAALFLLFVSFGLPVMLEELERLYPPVQSRNLWGRLFGAEDDDPLLTARQRQLTVLTWLGGVGGVTVLLLGALPRTVASASVKAKDLEASASTLPGPEVAGLSLHREASTSAPYSHVEPPPTDQPTRVRKRVGDTDANVTPDTDLRALQAAQMTIEPLHADAGRPESVGPEQRYQIVKELGRGGMGVVYQALDTVLEREIALKELPIHLTAQREFARRFKQEARVLARLSHPHIVQVHDLVERDDRIWIAMEFVKGGTLADEIARSGGRLPVRRAVHLAQQICWGLAYAHEQGVIHRDIKPINVLLTQEEGSAKITDFGLAKHVDASIHTQQGTLLGSPSYMSPEQAAGRKSDALSDAYSFGITLYEMLTGRVPFEGEVAAVLAQHISRPPARLRSLRIDVPERLELVVHRLLAKRPEKRPPSMRLVAKALSHIAREQFDPSNQNQPGEPIDEPPGSHRRQLR